MNSNIEDFNQALKESMLNHFGSLDKAIEYGDALEKKNEERQSAFIKKIENRKNEQKNL